MESMPPMRWDQLATKDNIDRLEARGDRLEIAIQAQGERLETAIHDQGERLLGVIDAQGQRQAGEMALLEGRLSVRYVEPTGMIVFAMMTLFVGVVAVMVTTLS